jgi:glycosyltransferase involved in cell wall biosynthesis
VFNGENFLAEALDAILAQTYQDFELIISDNASTDDTEAICRDYMSRDNRIRYYRNDRNIGPNANFCRVFELSTRQYFKWACHDDMIAPTYLEKCVAVLDREPQVVLCHSATRVIGELGDGIYRDLVGMDAGSPTERFETITLRRHWRMDILGVIRADVLRRSRLLQPYFGSDNALLAELALQGPFARVEEPLFINRDHPGRTMRAYSFAGRLRFHSPDGKARKIFPQWALFKDYVRAVRSHVQDAAERRRCHLVLARWWVTNWNAARVGLDLVASVAPGLSDVVFRLRDRYHSQGIGVR